MILYKLGVIIIVDAISIMKLRPIKPTNKAIAIFGYIAGLELTNPSKFCLKKITQKIANNPVLIIGTDALAKTDPNKVFFLNGFIIKPATIPATIVFKMQVIIVPTGLIEKKTEIVLGEVNTITPQIRPRNPPTTGPYNIAPIAIGISDKLIFEKEGLI